MAPRKTSKSTSLFAALRNNLAQNVLGLGLWGGQLGFGERYGTPVNQLNTVFNNNRGNYVTNQRFELNELYTQQGIVQNLIDVPVEDALKGGIEIKTQQAEPEQIEAVQYKMEEQDDFSNINEAGRWRRLFGGSGLLIISGQNKDAPFNPGAVREGYPLDFHTADMWELPFASYKTDPQKMMGFGLLDSATGFDYYGETIERSHVLTMKGLRAPSLIRPRFLGWGVSVIEGTISAINQYLKSVNLLFEILDEYKIDYYKIKNFNSDLQVPGAQMALMERLTLMNQAKNYQNAAVMDSEDDFIQKMLSFAGFAEIFAQIRMQYAAAVKMPMSKIFGISSTGFSSGEDDIENYNGMIESTERPRMRPVIQQIVQLRFQQMFGYIPSDLRVSFKPLRTLSSEQEQNVKTQKFNRVFQSKSGGEITTEEFRDACNKDELLGIQLDRDIDESELTSSDEESTPEGNGALSGKKSVTEAPEAKA